MITDAQYDGVFADPALPRPKKELSGKVKLADGTVCGWQMTTGPELSIRMLDNPRARSMMDAAGEAMPMLPPYVLALHVRYWNEVAKRLDQIQ